MFIISHHTLKILIISISYYRNQQYWIVVTEIIDMYWLKINTTQTNRHIYMYIYICVCVCVCVCVSKVWVLIRQICCISSFILHFPHIKNNFLLTLCFSLSCLKNYVSCHKLFEYFSVLVSNRYFKCKISTQKMTKTLSTWNFRNFIS